MFSVVRAFLKLLYRNDSEPLKETASPPIKPVMTPEENNPTEIFPATEKGMPLAQKKLKRQALYETMEIRPNILSNNGKILVANVPAVVRQRTTLMITNRARYESVSHSFPNPGLKWWIVALIHELEGQQNFNTYLGNGQRLDKKTTIVPIGRGPFQSFKAGAIDAIRLEGLDKNEDWSMGNLLYVLEKFNGFGYTMYKGINSPYVWSGSNWYTSGKYIADGVYVPSAVSTQIGIALMMKDLDVQRMI